MQEYFLFLNLCLEGVTGRSSLQKTDARWWRVVKSWQRWGKVVRSSKNYFSVHSYYMIYGCRDILSLKIPSKNSIKFVCFIVYLWLKTYRFHRIFYVKFLRTKMSRYTQIIYYYYSKAAYEYLYKV